MENIEFIAGILIIREKAIANFSVTRYKWTVLSRHPRFLNINYYPF